MVVSEKTSPPSAAARGQFIASVTGNEPLCREHFRLTLRLAEFPPTAPGQFVQVACRDVEVDDGEVEVDWADGQPPRVGQRELAAPLAVLRRPFSLADRRDLPGGGVEMELIHRVVGIGTDWLAHLKSGGRVGVMGPLGNRFMPPPAGGQALFVGGGVGIPPMLYLARTWGKLGQFRSAAFCGALSRDLLPFRLIAESPAADDTEPRDLVGEFTDFGVRAVLSTDDGSFGYRGYVTQALEHYLDRHTVPNTVIYTCGPELMMRRVADIATSRGIECQVAVERAMACGMGTCQSCCIRLRRDPARDGRAFAGKDWIYKLACTDGPVFKATDLLW